MRRVLFCAAVLTSICPRAQPVAQTVGQTTPAELAAHLRNWASDLKDEDVPPALENLPPTWYVHTAEGEYAVSTAPLKQWTGGADRKPNWLSAASWMQQLAGQLDSYQAFRPSPPETQSRLQAILKRPEFTATARPGYLAEWQQRLERFIGRMLEKLFGGLLRHSQDRWRIFYLVLAPALITIGYFVYRLLRSRAASGQDSLARQPSVAAIRPWQQWLEAARAAAAEGDLRKAIQCAYWTAVTRLQESGELPREATYTPREYLRVFRGPVAQFDRLRMLTNDLEKFWYAQSKASVEDVQSSFGSLEMLGCPME